MDNKNILRKVAIFLFVIYIVLLFLVLVLKYPTGMLQGTFENILAGKTVIRLRPRLVPFQTIMEYVGNARAINDWFVKNLACNLIMFMPYGFLVPCFSKIKGWKLIVSGCLLSVFIEILQYITAFGQMDIDDVILNTLGTVVGYAGFLIIRYMKRKIKSK